MHWLRRDSSIVMECFHPTKRGLGARVVRGGAWFVTLVVTRAILAIGTTAVLARLLTPADFGYVGMAAVATDLAVMLCTLGVPSIIVQAPRLTRLDRQFRPVAGRDEPQRDDHLARQRLVDLPLVEAVLLDGQLHRVHRPAAVAAELEPLCHVSPIQTGAPQRPVSAS